MRKKLHTSYLAELEDQDSFQAAGSASKLQQLLASFERLDMVIWDVYNKDWPELLPDSAMYRRTGVDGLSSEPTLRFLETCLGIQSHRLRSFKAGQLRWTDFESESIHLSALSGIFRLVQILHLVFEAGYLQHKDIDQRTGNSFKRNLHGAKELRNFRIGFDFVPTSSSIPAVKHLWPAFISGRHPHL